MFSSRVDDCGLFVTHWVVHISVFTVVSGHDPQVPLTAFGLHNALRYVCMADQPDDP